MNDTVKYDIRVDVERWLKDFSAQQAATEKAIGLGIAAGMEDAAGDVRANRLGPRVWEPESPLPRLAYAMAVNIAKREGHSDFTKNGAGRQRVRELVGKMPVTSAGRKRPPAPQSVWIQSGFLRQSLDWGAQGRQGVSSNSSVPGGTGEGVIAVGFLTARAGYAEDVERRYPFAHPAVQESISSGRMQAHIDAFVQAAEKNRGN